MRWQDAVLQNLSHNLTLNHFTNHTSPTSVVRATECTAAPPDLSKSRPSVSGRQCEWEPPAKPEPEPEPEPERPSKLQRRYDHGGLPCTPLQPAQEGLAPSDACAARTTSGGLVQRSAAQQCQVEVAKLTWTDNVDARPVDLVLGADLVYSSGAVAESLSPSLGLATRRCCESQYLTLRSPSVDTQELPTALLPSSTSLLRSTLLLPCCWSDLPIVLVAPHTLRSPSLPQLHTCECARAHTHTLRARTHALRPLRA